MEVVPRSWCLSRRGAASWVCLSAAARILYQRTLNCRERCKFALFSANVENRPGLLSDGLRSFTTPDLQPIECAELFEKAGSYTLPLFAHTPVVRTSLATYVRQLDERTAVLHPEQRISLDVLLDSMWGGSTSVQQLILTSGRAIPRYSGGRRRARSSFFRQDMKTHETLTGASNYLWVKYAFTLAFMDIYIEWDLQFAQNRPPPTLARCNFGWA
jgi:hypothetical protein